MRYGKRKMLINGEWVEGSKGDTFPTINPANREVLAEVARGYEADVDQAVDAAMWALARGPWADMLPAARARLLYRIGTLIREHAAELAEMETLDCGKPISQARADMETSAQYFEFYAGVADKLFGSTIPIGKRALDSMEQVHTNPNQPTQVLHDPSGSVAWEGRNAYAQKSNRAPGPDCIPLCPG